jgi:predicted nucleic acid-binding protein
LALRNAGLPPAEPRSTASPKLWADAWLLAVAKAARGTLVTFDRALAAHGARCLLPEHRT